MLHSYALKAPVSFRDRHETHNIYFVQARLCVYSPVGACGKFQMYIYVYIYVCMYVITYVCMYVYIYVYICMYVYICAF
jgi:hypothetical protein